MKEECINAYILRVNSEGIQYRGYFASLENSLKAKQELVGGNIEVVRITPEIDAIINEEGKLRCLPMNRLWTDGSGETYDLLVGNIVCVRHNEEGEFTSILETDKKIIDQLLIPIKGLYELERENNITQRVIFVRPDEDLLNYKEG